MHAALSMALVMISLGVVYLAEQAPFLGVVQVFVYTGAVMMLFLFVLMLIGVDSSDSLVETIKGQRALATVFGLGLVLLLVGVLRQVTFPPAVGLADANSAGNVSALAAKIFGPYVWAFEVTGALLITAALGAMVLAHRERLTPRPTQRELSQQRVAFGAVQGPAARARGVRPAQRRGHPRAAARRHSQRAVGLAGAARPRAAARGGRGGSGAGDDPGGDRPPARAGAPRRRRRAHGG